MLFDQRQTMEKHCPQEQCEENIRMPPAVARIDKKRLADNHPRTEMPDVIPGQPRGQQQPCTDNPGKKRQRKAPNTVRNQVNVREGDFTKMIKGHGDDGKPFCRLKIHMGQCGRFFIQISIPD